MITRFHSYIVRTEVNIELNQVYNDLAQTTLLRVECVIQAFHFLVSGRIDKPESKSGVVHGVDQGG